MFSRDNFFKRKFSDLMGQTVVSWQEKTVQGPPFEIRATQAGVYFTGRLDGEISTEQDLSNFAELVSDSWMEHQKLAPKLSRTLSGH